jgi:hypothetical protein
VCSSRLADANIETCGRSVRRCCHDDRRSTSRVLVSFAAVLASCGHRGRSKWVCEDVFGDGGGPALCTGSLGGLSKRRSGPCKGRAVALVKGEGSGAL